MTESAPLRVLQALRAANCIESDYVGNEEPLLACIVRLEHAAKRAVERAAIAEWELARLRRQMTTLGTDGRTIRDAAYELVERDLRDRDITKLLISKHTICAERAGVEQTVRAPMPTLIGAVDLLGEPSQ